MSQIEEAVELLEQIRGVPQSIDERKHLAIELAALMIGASQKEITSKEKKIYSELSRLMHDPLGKAFTTSLTDECFRSSSNKRIADQLTYLLQRLGIPKYLSWLKKVELFCFRTLGVPIAQFLVPLAKKALRKQTDKVILPAEESLLNKHIQERKNEAVRLNLNHLGEAILSEQEAKKRLHIYLDDLNNPEIDYVSIKISTIYSQIQLIAFEKSVQAIAERLKELYRAAMDKEPAKFVNLDMEEYRDLDLTVKAFKQVLDEPEFHQFSAGIVLQAYLPDSYYYQKLLTEWAKKRVENGGAPIKVRLVKGANLAMEQVEASLKGWPQTPYTSKVEVDANYKRMLNYGCLPENARAVHLGIASHNLFDIAYAMILRLENQVEPYTSFEMLEGMADHIRRVVQQLTGGMLLYCPVSTREDFQHAIAYLIRRLDENTGTENFLRYVFGLKPGTEAWDFQVELFLESIDLIESVSEEPRREQNRQIHPPLHDPKAPFDNEADTDFALAHNRKWAQDIALHWKHLSPPPIPCVIGGEEIFANQDGIGFDPNGHVKQLYIYTKADESHIDKAIGIAKAYEPSWASTTVEHRSQLLAQVAQKLRERRGELIGAMLLDGAKIISESDPEVSEAIDFAEYYRRQMEKLSKMADIEWRPKGTIVVASPWNFPCAIPIGGILASLVAGNCVIFKPSSETILVAWHVVNALWDAGIPKEALQFVPCSGGGAGQKLICDPRINGVVLTGGTETAQKFIQMRPDLHLAAETGGKNSIIITALSDRDLAMKDLLQSAFGNVGQKCSAASIAILEAEVYDDPNFLRALRDAAKSLKVGPSDDLSVKIGPLIHEPRGDLLRGLTTLEEGEEWLLEPKQDAHNPCLWSPGIKKGVREGSFTHMTELFGPVLALMRADNLEHAIDIANQVPYGLTSGLQSLNEREQITWMEKIEAGNLYINRTITGAIVRRQPFGGCKASSFGGGSKAGGPNYLTELMDPIQIALPQQRHPVSEEVNQLTSFLEKINLSIEELGIWTASCANYAYWWKRLRLDRDPSKILGQDNFFHYVPRNTITFRITKEAKPLDALRVVAAALSCGAKIQISCEEKILKIEEFSWLNHVAHIPVIAEETQEFLQRLKEGQIERLRLVTKASEEIYEAASFLPTHIIDSEPLMNGRLELLHYIREVSISIDYHRYGNLGLREGELRKPVL